jgi:CBS domain-containing protein
VAIGVSPDPIRRELTGSETQSARIVLVILAPPRLAARYLQVLGAFARLLRSDDVRDAMLEADSAESLAKIAALQTHVIPEQLAVRDVMMEQPRTTRPDTPLREAALHMAYAGVGALPVVGADGLLVGLLGEKELLAHLTSSYLVAGAARRPAMSGVSARRSVRDIMTRQVLCVSPEQPLAEVASLMTNKDVEGVPVVREGVVVGFLTRSDIIRKLIGS